MKVKHNDKENRWEIDDNKEHFFITDELIENSDFNQLLQLIYIKGKQVGRDEEEAYQKRQQERGSVEE